MLYRVQFASPVVDAYVEADNIELAIRHARLIAATKGSPMVFDRIELVERVAMQQSMLKSTEKACKVCHGPMLRAVERELCDTCHGVAAEASPHSASTPYPAKAGEIRYEDAKRLEASVVKDGWFADCPKCFQPLVRTRLPESVDIKCLVCGWRMQA